MQEFGSLPPAGVLSADAQLECLEAAQQQIGVAGVAHAAHNTPGVFDLGQHLA